MRSRSLYWPWTSPHSCTGASTSTSIGWLMKISRDIMTRKLTSSSCNGQSVARPGGGGGSVGTLELQYLESLPPAAKRRSIMDSTYSSFLLLLLVLLEVVFVVEVAVVLVVILFFFSRVKSKQNLKKEKI